MPVDSDTTPLLAGGGLPGPNVMQDHPAFLRASHSPWRFIPQNVLVILRGWLLAYLVAGSIMITHYKLTTPSDYTNWRHVFDFAVISMFFTVLYHIITFSWTFTHLYYPHPDDNEGGIEGYIISAMSLPRNMGSLRKQFYFSMFYTMTCVFAFMNSTIYWFITRQQSIVEPPVIDPPVLDPPSVGLGQATSGFPIHDKPFSDLFGEGWYKAFNLINLYGVNSVIMVIEILLLNSIKRPYALGSHIFGLLVSSGLYLGWAGIGHQLTGWFSYEWLDKEKVGSSEAVAAYCIGFVLLAPIMYILQQGFVAIREGLTRSLSSTRQEATAAEPLES